MNLIPWRHADADTKHDVIVMLAIHGLLIAMNLGLYMFGAYDVKMMLDGAAHPAHTRLVLGISNTLKNHFILILPLIIIATWLDAHAFLALRKFLGKEMAATWNISVVIILIGFTCFFVWGMKAEIESIGFHYMNSK